MACRKRAKNWIVSSTIPNVTKACGIQTSVPLYTEVCPESKLRQVK